MSLMEVTSESGQDTRPGKLVLRLPPPCPIGTAPSLILPVEQWFYTDLFSTHSADRVAILQKSWVSKVKGLHPQNSLYLYQLSTPVPNPYPVRSTKNPMSFALSHSPMEFQIPEGWVCTHLGYFYLSLPWATVFLYLLHGPSICLFELSPQHWEHFSLSYIFFLISIAVTHWESCSGKSYGQRRQQVTVHGIARTGHNWVTLDFILCLKGSGDFLEDTSDVLICFVSQSFKAHSFLQIQESSILWLSIQWC